jgi:pentatricopeptide repeat protein
MLSFLRNIESRYASSSRPAVSGRRGLYDTVASSSRPSQAASSTPTTSAQTKCHATAPPPFPFKDAYYLHLLRASSTPCTPTSRAHPSPSLFLRNTLLAAYCRRLGHGPLPARRLLDGMPRRNAVSFNLLIDAYSRDSQPDAALQTFQRARRAVKPDRFTYAAALAACSRAARLQDGKAVHALAVLEGLAGGGAFVSNSLVGMYARCGDMGEARRVFDAAAVHDDVSWNSLLSGYVPVPARARRC